MTALTVFSDIDHFEISQRMAKALTSSTLVPAHFQGEQNIGNALIGLEMAQRMDMSPLAVFQSLYVVHGRPAFSAAFIIACFNASGRFSPIQYEQVGKEGADSYGFRAVSSVISTSERIVGTAVTMAIAKADGWTRNDKYKSMPELMLKYRAATWLVRQTAPELTMGLHTVEEQDDIRAPERNISPPTVASADIMAEARTLPDTPPTPAAEPLRTVDAKAEYDVTVTVQDATEPAQEAPEPVQDIPEEEVLEAAPAAPEHWPQQRNKVWFDSRGIAFNALFHGYSRGEDAPAVNARGEYRRKRGHDAEKLKAYEQEQLHPAPAPVATEPPPVELTGEPPRMDKPWFLRMVEDATGADDLDEVDAVLTSCAGELGEAVVGTIEDAIEARKAELDIAF